MYTYEYIYIFMYVYTNTAKDRDSKERDLDGGRDSESVDYSPPKTLKIKKYSSPKIQSRPPLPLDADSEVPNCSVLRCVTVCCSVVQCVEVCCSMVQCGAVCCSVLQ